MAKRRVYLFGIGSPAWQRATGHIVNALGVPIPSHGPAKRRRPSSGRTKRR